MKRWLKLGCGLILAVPLLIAASVAGFFFVAILVGEKGLSLRERVLEAWPAGAVMVGAVALGLLLGRYFLSGSDTGPEWTDGTIRTREVSVGFDGRWALLFFGGLPLAAGLAVLWKGVAAEQLFYAAGGLVFATIGGGVTGMGGYVYLLRHWYGDKVLELDHVPGRLGDRLEGRVRTGVPADKQPEDGFEITLFCRSRDEDDYGDARNYATHEVYDRHVIWQEEREVQARSSQDGRTLVVPISIDLPADLPPSTFGGTKTPTNWILQVKASLSGVDYRAVFEVPIAAEGEDVEAEEWTA
jgi:hypothetical protein